MSVYDCVNGYGSHGGDGAYFHLETAVHVYPANK